MNKCPIVRHGIDGIDLSLLPEKPSFVLDILGGLKSNSLPGMNDQRLLESTKSMTRRGSLQNGGSLLSHYTQFLLVLVVRE